MRLPIPQGYKAVSYFPKRKKLAALPEPKPVKPKPKRRRRKKEVTEE